MKVFLSEYLFPLWKCLYPLPAPRRCKYVCNWYFW